MNLAADIPADPSSAATSFEPRREIAGFWRRSGALALDVAILWAVGRALAFLAYERLVQLGQNGWIVGLVIATVYSGAGNSRLAGGGTLGKWICGIEVVDRAGNRLGLGRSLWRAFVITLPWFLPAGPIRMNWFGYFVLLAEKVIPLGALYLVAFNRRNRQSIDDIAARSFVVRRKTPGQVCAQPTWMIHGWVVLLIAGGCFSRLVSEFTLPPGMYMPQTGADWKRAEKVMGALQQPAFMGGVGGRFFFPRGPNRPDGPDISLNAEWHSRPPNAESAAAQVVAAMLVALPDAKRVKQIEVEIRYGYSIGLSSDYHSVEFVHTPEEWLRLAAGT